MDGYAKIFKSLAKRLIPALILGALGWKVIATASGGMAAAGPILIGMALFITAAIIVAAPIAALIAEPTGGLFLPSAHFSRPQPMYSIPQSRRKQGHYKEAIAGFEEIADNFPGETQPYIEMIDIAIVELRDADRAKHIYLRGMCALKKQDDKDSLKRMYEAIRTRMDEPTTGYQPPIPPPASPKPEAPPRQTPAGTHKGPDKSAETASTRKRRIPFRPRTPENGDSVDGKPTSA